MRGQAAWTGLLILGLLAASPTGVEARTFEAIADEVLPDLPALAPLPQLPEGFAVTGSRQADGPKAFRAYVQAVRDRCAQEVELAAAQKELDLWLQDPAKFQPPGSLESSAFLKLALRFAARRSLEPIATTSIGLIGFRTWRPDTSKIGGPENQDFLKQMQGLTDFLGQTIQSLNEAQPAAEPLHLIDWRGQRKDGEEAWVVGARVGRGPHRLVIITHVDTVSPIHEDWKPFEGRLEVLPFRDGQRLFLRGRGSIDDKGPTAAALHALDLLRAIFSGTKLFEHCTFELLADTAEESNRLIPDYFDANGVPNAGIVLDAAWSLYAEKGSERPIFRSIAKAPATPGLHLVSLSTPPGPTNQIPERAEAVFSAPAADLEASAKRLQQEITDYLAGDGPQAKLELKVDGQQIRVTAIGSGAAHGSAPAVNKANGHNPLACLSVFVARLHQKQALQPNGALSVPLFFAWGFGHNVFGEDHGELLAKDPVFQDGTTYALTRMTSGEAGTEAKIDIRYALPHHAAPWDGKTFGILPGPSRFQGIFEKLVAQFNATLPPEIPPVTFETRTSVGPDLKDRQAPIFQSLLAAYQAVVGSPSPILAIGGGTDAKGMPMLYAAGPNFSSDLTAIFEAPVNYHGLGESAPVEDLVRSTQILVLWLATSGFAAPAAAPTP